MRKATQSSGIMVSDSTQEASKVMVTTWNSERVYSPTSETARNWGRKAADVVSDAVSNGKRSSLAAARAASRTERPSRAPTWVDSTMTMALSTSMPREMISAPSDT